MIEGFEDYTSRLTAEELAMADHLARRFRPHRGKEKAVTNTAIRNTLGEDYGIVAPARVRKLIHHIRTADMVPCLVAGGKGYFIATSSDEVLRYINGLDSRVKAIRRLAKALKRQHDERFTQGKLFEQPTVKKNRGIHHGSI